MRTTVTVKVTVPVLLLSCIHELEFFEIIKMKSKMSVHPPSSSLGLLSGSGSTSRRKTLSILLS